MAFCKYCGKYITADSKFCVNCGESVDADFIDVTPQQTTQAVYEQPQPQPQPAPWPTSTSMGSPQQAPAPVYIADRKNPGVAAVLSFFWAGLGQIYNGQLAKGLLFMVAYAVCVLLIFVLIGIILVPILWIIGMIDAYTTAQRYNETQQRNERLYY
jgi:TM2 domain-containing membrane protein YozV